MLRQQIQLNTYQVSTLNLATFLLLCDVIYANGRFKSVIQTPRPIRALPFSQETTSA
jgi:hypothetical protein